MTAKLCAQSQQALKDCEGALNPIASPCRRTDLSARLPIAGGQSNGPAAKQTPRRHRSEAMNGRILHVKSAKP